MSSFTEKLNELKFRYKASEFRAIVPVFLFILVCGIVAVSFSFCTKTEVDLRSLVPKDTIIYLETKDLGNSLNALTASEAFKESSKSATDFSATNGMQVAVAVSGFETSENKVTDEQSVLNFKPKFTAIAETNAWGWQVSSLVENALNTFVKKTYGNNVKLEQKSVNGTERYIWTSNDDRQTFAVISGSQIFFGNDEESINQCLSAKRGETESLQMNEGLNEKYSGAKGKLAFGYISNEGIKQIADFAGVSVAVEQSEDANSRGFISRILPQILNNTTKEITWTSEKTDKGIEDRIFISTNNETSKVLSETLISSSKNQDEFYDYIPDETDSVTRYNLKNPQVAFRSLLLVTAKNLDKSNATLISAISNSLLSSYGVANAEAFLSEVESELITAQIDEDGSFAIAKAKDLEKVKSALIKGFTPNEELSKQENREIWTFEEDDLSVAFDKDILILGESKTVLKCLAVWKNRKISPIGSATDVTKSKLFGTLRKSNATVTTLVKYSETTENIVKVLGQTNEKNVISNSLTETRFSLQGIERKYISEYGFLGTIIEQFGSE